LELGLHFHAKDPRAQGSDGLTNAEQVCSDKGCLAWLLVCDVVIFCSVHALVQERRSSRQPSRILFLRFVSRLGIFLAILEICACGFAFAYFYF
jgi:hypothetical protein